MLSTTPFPPGKWSLCSRPFRSIVTWLSSRAAEGFLPCCVSPSFCPRLESGAHHSRVIHQLTPPQAGHLLPNNYACLACVDILHHTTLQCMMDEISMVAAATGSYELHLAMWQLRSGSSPPQPSTTPCMPVMTADGGGGLLVSCVVWASAASQKIPASSQDDSTHHPQAKQAQGLLRPWNMSDIVVPYIGAEFPGSIINQC